MVMAMLQVFYDVDIFYKVSNEFFSYIVVSLDTEKKKDE
jgi:hypothetical protein